MKEEKLKIQQLAALMTRAVREHRWLKLRALNVEMTLLLQRCNDSGAVDGEFRALEARVHRHYQQMLTLCQQDSAALQAKMARHRENSEGMNAYGQLALMAGNK